MGTVDRAVTLDQRAERERAYHNALYEDAGDARASCGRFYAIARRSQGFYWETVLFLARDGRVLEYGCGDGRWACVYELAKRGALATGIDISDVAIELANKRCADLQLQNRATFEQMNGEALTFADNTFDLIHGNGILHHLNIAKAFGEISRTLKPIGTAVFIEPLGHNCFLNLYRRATPKLRTTDEHPLKSADMESAKNYFEQVELHYFHLSSLVSIPFLKSRVFEPMLNALERFDEALFRLIPGVQRFAWQVVMLLSKPRGK
jgi:ubiquinone/menaquinone biosynthesis C-methylase UbiE